MSLYLLRKLATRDESLPETSRQTLLAALGPPRFVEAGVTIIREGSRPDECTLVVAGWACRFSTLHDGRRQTLALHISGDFVDLHSFPMKVMDHSVETLTECSISTLSHSKMRRITETDPHLTRVLWMHTLVDAAILRKWLLSSGQRSALEHTAHLICEVFTRLEVVGLASAGKPFDMPMSQQEFGSAVGITAVHVSRTLAELRSRGLFTWRSRKAEILDWPGLLRLAEFDPGYLSLQNEPR